jgi:hypothetical protein
MEKNFSKNYLKKSLFVVLFLNTHNHEHDEEKRQNVYRRR